MRPPPGLCGGFGRRIPRSCCRCRCHKRRFHACRVGARVWSFDREQALYKSVSYRRCLEQARTIVRCGAHTGKSNKQKCAPRDVPHLRRGHRCFFVLPEMAASAHSAGTTTQSKTNKKNTRAEQRTQHEDKQSLPRRKSNKTSSRKEQVAKAHKTPSKPRP